MSEKKDLGNVFYVYIYYHPITNIPFYVGKGKDDRAWFHLKSKSHTFFIRTINKIRKEYNCEPIIKIYDDNLSEPEAFELEMKLIKKYGRRNNGSGILINLTNGGEGTSGILITEATRNKLKNRIPWNKGIPMSEEQKKKLYESHKGKITSEETKKKLSRANKGKIISQETREKIRDSLMSHLVSEETRKKMSEAKLKNNTKNNAKFYKISNIQTGNIEIIKCLKDFCKNHNFPYVSIWSCLKNKRIYKRVYKIESINRRQHE